MNERMQILKMLEDGKINAQEAERLLEALSHSESKEKKNKFKIWSSIEGIPKFVSAAIGNAIDDPQCEESMHYAAKKKLSFNGISGDLTIKGDNTDKIEIQRDGLAKIKQDDETLYIKTLSGDVSISLPHNTEISIAGISGNVCITDIEGIIRIESVSGDVIGKNLSGSMFGEFVSGDINLDYAKVQKIKIRSRSGDVVLQLGKKQEAYLDIESDTGSISCDFELKNEIKSDNKLKGILNKATAEIEIKSKSGDVTIKERQ